MKKLIYKNYTIEIYPKEFPLWVTHRGCGMTTDKKELSSPNKCWWCGKEFPKDLIGLINLIRAIYY